MDLNDDAFVDWVAEANVDAVAFPTNWLDEPEAGVSTWAYWAWRLAGQRAALLAANTWGTDGGLTFAGTSAVVQRGRILASLPVRGDGVVRAVLDP